MPEARQDIVEIPKELIKTHKHVDLCIDIMKVCGLWFLTTISKNLMYRTAFWLPNKKVQMYRSVLDKTLRIYTKAHLRIKQIFADNKFRPIMDDIQDELGITMNYAAAGEHVPEAERNNRTLKERYRSLLHALPYDYVTRTMVIEGVQDIAKKLNFFPPKGGVSSHYSPHAILHQQVIDYNRHCKYAHGSYVQAHDDPPNKNDMKPRTLDCIYLHALIDNVQGGHRLLNLSTGEAITHPRVTELPVTALVKRRVHAIAKKEKMKSWKVQSNESDDSSLAEVEDNQNPYKDDDDYDSDYEESEDEDEDLSYDTDRSEEEESVSSYESWTQVNKDEDSDGEELKEDSDESSDTDEEPSDEENEEEQPTIQSSSRTNMGIPESRYEPSMRGQSYAQYEPEGEQELVLKIMAKTIEKLCFVETFTLKQAIKKYGKKGAKSGIKEMKQLHDRMGFYPRKKEDMTKEELDKAMQSLLFFMEKRDGTIKGHHCANGSTQRSYMEKGKSISPTASADAILLTAIIDAEEEMGCC